MADPAGRRGPSLESLITASARGDEQAFQRLYEASVDTLFGVAVRILRRSDWAEEVLQESFISIWRHAARFDAAKGTPMTWLSRIVRNQAFDWIHASRPDGRERAHHISLDGSDQALFDVALESPTDDRMEGFGDALQAERLGSCLQALDARQRQSIALVFFHGLSHAELAQHLQQPLGTVKAWVRRGLKSLRNCLALQH